LAFLVRIKNKNSYLCKTKTRKLARDKFHQEVRAALENEGWTITDDPLYMKIGRIPIHIDIGAEKLITAEKEGEKIAVEVKTFGMPSFITALHEAVGKYIIYRTALKLVGDTRVLYLAMPENVFLEYAEEPLLQTVFEQNQFKILLYQANSTQFLQWIK
jgi:hypothetical protein